MGFKLPAGVTGEGPSKPLDANTDDVKKQVVGGHPPSTLYQLMIGDVRSTRDKIAAAHVLTSLFIMEITPEGTTNRITTKARRRTNWCSVAMGTWWAGEGSEGREGAH